MNEAIEFDGDSDRVELPRSLGGVVQDLSEHGNHGAVVDLTWHGRVLDSTEVKRVYEESR